MALQPRGELRNVRPEGPQRHDPKREVGRVLRRRIAEVRDRRAGRVAPAGLEPEHRPGRQRRIGPAAGLREPTVRLLAGC